MTTWETNVTEIVWESQTAPGITWTTVVGGTSTGTPANRLVPPGGDPATDYLAPPEVSGEPSQWKPLPAGGASAPQVFHGLQIGGDFDLTDPFWEMAPVGFALWAPTHATPGLYLADGTDTLKPVEFPVPRAVLLQLPQAYETIADFFGNNHADGSSFVIPAGEDPAVEGLDDNDLPRTIDQHVRTTLTPANYTPDDGDDHVRAHLRGIDQALGAAASGPSGYSQSFLLGGM